MVTPTAWAREEPTEKDTTPLALLVTVVVAVPALWVLATPSMLSTPLGARAFTLTEVFASGAPSALRRVALMVGPAVATTPVGLEIAKELFNAEYVVGQSPAKNAAPLGLPSPEAMS
jgi:hypothetical protein